MGNKYSIKQVPCAGCTLCCQGDAVRLVGDDSSFEYQTEPHPFIPGALMLAHKSNGECVYLGKDGCRIHDHTPSLCRLADCRNLALRFNYTTARRLHDMNRLDIRVWDQGHKLLEKMTDQDSSENGDKMVSSQSTAPSHQSVTRTGWKDIR